MSTPRARRSARRSSSVVVEGAFGAAASGRPGAAGAGGALMPVPARAPAPRRSHALVHPLVVHLGLVVDRLLDLLRVTDVHERRGAVVARRPDVDVAGSDHALHHALLEPDVVDLLQRDLDRALRDESFPLDHAVARDHEVGGEPGHEPADRIGDEHDHHHDRDDQIEVERGDEPDPHAHDHQRDRGSHGQRDGVRAKIEHQFFAGDQELPWERHGRTVPGIGGRATGPHEPYRRCSSSPEVTVASPSAVSTIRLPPWSMSTATPSIDSPVQAPGPDAPPRRGRHLTPTVAHRVRRRVAARSVALAEPPQEITQQLGGVVREAQARRFGHAGRSLEVDARADHDVPQTAIEIERRTR